MYPHPVYRLCSGGALLSHRGHVHSHTVHRLITGKIGRRWSLGSGDVYASTWQVLFLRRFGDKTYPSVAAHCRVAAANKSQCTSVRFTHGASIHLLSFHTALTASSCSRGDGSYHGSCVLPSSAFTCETLVQKRCLVSISQRLHPNTVKVEDDKEGGTTADIRNSSADHFPPFEIEGGMDSTVEKNGEEIPGDVSYASSLLKHIHDNQSLDNGAFLSDSSITSWFLDILVSLKIAFDCPWWTLLPATGFLLRAVTLPIAVVSERDRRKRQMVDPEISKLKDKMRRAYESGDTKNYEILRTKTKAAYRYHDLSVMPTSVIQMLLLGIAFSLATPALRSMSVGGQEWKSFVFEQPLWFTSLANPDDTNVAAVLLWMLMMTNIVAGWMVGSKIRHGVSSATSMDRSTFLLGRVLPVLFATFFALYSGTKLPVAALLFLVPAFGTQSFFLRICRFPAVERALHLAPEGLRSLSQIYVGVVERRSPQVVYEWRRRMKDNVDFGAVGSKKDEWNVGSTMKKVWKDIQIREMETNTSTFHLWGKRKPSVSRTVFPSF